MISTTSTQRRVGKAKRAHAGLAIGRQRRGKDLAVDFDVTVIEMWHG
jgi:hypothetical protein